MVNKNGIPYARRLIRDALETDQNEADTRRRIERILEKVCEVDPLIHLSRERAVRGAGEAEYVDFAYHIDGSPEPTMMVEIKRVGLPLANKHLNQLSKYAIDAGCNWALLTNGKQWQLYGVTYGKPPKLTEILSWDLLEDKPARIAECMQYLSPRSLKRNEIKKLWERRIAMLPENILQAIFAHNVIGSLRREIKKSTKYQVQADDVTEGLRRILNERCLHIVDELNLPKPPPRTRAARAKKAEPMETLAGMEEAAPANPTPTDAKPAEPTPATGIYRPFDYREEE